MEVSRSDGNGRSEVALSAAEEVFLRRFVRRHALAGPAGRGLLAAVLLAVGLGLWPASAPEQSAAGPGPAAPTGLTALEAEIGALRALADRPAADPEAAAAVAELARRIEAIAREIALFRTRVESPPVPAPAPAAAKVGPELAAIADRLYQLELRQTGTESERTLVEAKLLARLHGIERRQEERESQDASALGSVLERMDRLERSRDVAEAHRLEGQGAVLARLAALESRLEAVPAAPQPR